MKTRTSIALVALGLLPAPALAQVALYSVPIAPTLGDQGGVAAIGDVDGDGAPDFAVAPSEGPGQVRSGADGSLLATFTPDGLGLKVLAPAGDVDADGTPDFVAGLPYFTSEGAVEVFDGATGQRIIRIDGIHQEDGLGISAIGLGDVNGDGHDDLAIGAVNRDFDASQRGRVEVRSGATWQVLWSRQGSIGANEFLGRFLADLGDLDGDGVRDLLAVGFNSKRIYSGANGALLFTSSTGAEGARGGFDATGDGLGDWIEYRTPSTTHQISLRSSPDAAGQWLFSSSQIVTGYDLIGDLDGDGLSEVAVGQAYTAGGGRVRLLRGADGQGLGLLELPQAGGQFGLQVARLGDVDGQGGLEFLVATNTATWVISWTLDCGAEPELQCPPTPNSASPTGALPSISGSTSMAANDLVLVATGVPPGQPGIFIAAANPKPPQPFGNGTLCLQAPIFRLGSTTAGLPGTVDEGVARLPLDLSAPNTPFAVGETWAVQLWHRDPAAGGAGQDLSGGMALTFCP